MMESNNPAMELNILPSQAYVAPPDFSLFDELGGNKLGGINPNGETDPLGCKDHRCIHSYDISLRRDQRTARISRVQGSVGLDDVVDQSAGHRPERAPKRTDHPRSDGILETVSASNGDHQLTYSYFL